MEGLLTWCLGKGLLQLKKCLTFFCVPAKRLRSFFAVFFLFVCFSENCCCVEKARYFLLKQVGEQLTSCAKNTLDRHRSLLPPQALVMRKRAKYFELPPSDTNKCCMIVPSGLFTTICHVTYLTLFDFLLQLGSSNGCTFYVGERETVSLMTCTLCTTALL